MPAMPIGGCASQPNRRATQHTMRGKPSLQRKGKMRIRSWIQCSTFLVAFMLLLSPVFTWAQDHAAEEALRKRAQAFWEARVKEDHSAQYQFLEPKLRRTLSLADYLKRQGPVQYLEARVGDVKVEDANGVVTVHLRVKLKKLSVSRKVPDLSKQERQVSDEWVRRSGEWYRPL